DKQLTPGAIAAAQALRAAGVPFTIVSARPPRGMAAIVNALGLTLPFAAFNGGSLVRPDLTLIDARRLGAATSAAALAILERHGIEAFVFADDAWLVRDPHGALTDRERRTVGFEPTAVADFAPFAGRIDKLVAASEDAGRLDEVEVELRAAL